jgi:hypothetical protein
MIWKRNKRPKHVPGLGEGAVARCQRKQDTPKQLTLVHLRIGIKKLFALICFCSSWYRRALLRVPWHPFALPLPSEMTQSSCGEIKHERYQLAIIGADIAALTVVSKLPESLQKVAHAVASFRSMLPAGVATRPQTPCCLAMTVRRARW